jgi:hypothetical protein
VIRLAIVLLFTTGIRRGELLRLTMSDYDSRDTTLLIRESKFHKSRLLPLHSEIAAEIDRYLRARTLRRLPLSADTALIGNATKGGRAYSGPGLQLCLQSLLKKCSIFTPKGKLPRIHDARHSFAVNALLRWYQEGADVGAKLPLLAAYKTAIDASLDDIETARAYTFFKRENEMVEAQTANVFKCPNPCGPHGPYPDVPLEGVPEDLPSVRALTGSSRVLASQLSDLIDEGNLLVRQFLGTDDVEFLSKNEITWQAKVEQLLTPYLDPRLVKALSQVNSKQFSTMNSHNEKGIVICNLVSAKTVLLTMFYNQLIGVGD